MNETCRRRFPRPSVLETFTAAKTSVRSTAASRICVRRRKFVRARILIQHARGMWEKSTDLEHMNNNQEIAFRFRKNS